MKIPYAEPDPAGSERAGLAKKMRDLATEIARLAPQALTRTNGEEADHKDVYPANFTKGLKHDECGLLDSAADYHCFVEAINSPDPTLFEKAVQTAETRFEADAEKAELLGRPVPESPFVCKADDAYPKWRGWESPRAGHVYELQGPDAGAVGMAPAPRVGSSELSAEMAEVYGLALLRDVPFTEICEGGGRKLCGGEFGEQEAVLNAAEIVERLNGMSFYSGRGVVSSTPHTVDESGLNGFERNRRFGRTLSPDGLLTPRNAFRGSTKGSHKGPYISQFMLIGANSLAGTGGGTSSFPAQQAVWDLQDGFIPFGSLSIDQRTLTAKNCLDYMTDWCSWLDVQNGANFKGKDVFEERRRFITTPRDLATYVHFDALYEAYLNACLIMLAMGVPASKGFPEASPSGRRDAFATFGGPHVLSLVCEVATRCLKAVRRQKFNYHRRARPEAMGGRLTLACLGDDIAAKLGCAAPGFDAMLKELDPFRDAILAHNEDQNSEAMRDMRRIRCPEDGCLPSDVEKDRFDACNLLLPMAFPEGSPMHPAYGAGHATVAGGCVTMLKAFFEMFEDCNSGVERKLTTASGVPIAYVPNEKGTGLVKDRKFGDELTIQGELDKLAANISIGRNMAGVHYYSDYYDSLRMGERIAVGILMEQAPTYGETMATSFKSFDGDMITITGEGGSCPTLSIMDRLGRPELPENWWLRHVSGAESSLDL